MCTTVVVSDWCITNFVDGWWVSIESIFFFSCKVVSVSSVSRNYTWHCQAETQIDGIVARWREMATMLIRAFN